MRYERIAEFEMAANMYSLPRAIGQMLIMGWDGTEVTPQIRNLIEQHHLGSVLLTAKNLKCSTPGCKHGNHALTEM
jgi:beta-N-acetylhexosaminidase